ncbi:MAG: InlB B-repeat-containing protein [Coriobacteriales bacterium]|nr:InlB B-repeat-containing protein [Coriobacteriales bacterium]
MKSRLCKTMLSTLLAGFIAVACLGITIPNIGVAEEASDQTSQQAASGKVAEEQVGFSYEHNPLYNPSCMRDVVVNPDAVYGFSPNPDSGSLTKYAAYDWTDPEVVAQAQKDRLDYFATMQEMTDLMESMLGEGKSIEEIARAVSAKRNEIRMASYKDDPEGLAAAKAHNLKQYGNENGPTPEFLFEKYGSWEGVLDHAFSTNSGMDACCGLYDMNYNKYVIFGQIPQCSVSFDTAGQAEAPETQLVYAGERATKPADPELSGSTFKGWFAKDATEPFDFSTPIAQDSVFTAVWEKATASTVKVEVDKSAPVSNASTNLKTETMLSKEEQTRVNEGTQARVWVAVNTTIATKELQENMATAATQKLGADSKVVCYVDVNLWKQLEDDDEPTGVHELGEKITITLNLSDEQIPENADKRTWCVTREHDGVVEVLDATFDAATKTVSFTSEKFSSFAVAYSEAKTEKEAEGEGTGTTSIATKEYVPYLSRSTGLGTTSSSARTTGTPGTSDPTSVVVPLASFVSGSAFIGYAVSRKARNRH